LKGGGKPERPKGEPTPEKRDQNVRRKKGNATVQWGGSLARCEGCGEKVELPLITRTPSAPGKATPYRYFETLAM